MLFVYCGAKILTYFGIFKNIVVSLLIFVEMIYINLLITKFEIFGLGLSFDTWFLIHTIYGIVLLIAGLTVGAWQGFYWWPRIYGKRV